MLGNSYHFFCGCDSSNYDEDTINIYCKICINMARRTLRPIVQRNVRCLPFSQKIWKFQFEVKWYSNFQENPCGNCGLPLEVLLFFCSEQNSGNSLTIWTILPFPGAYFSKNPETFQAQKSIFSLSLFQDREVYTPETSCMKRTFVHIKNTWIRQQKVTTEQYMWKWSKTWPS